MVPNGLRLHQFLVTKMAEANESVKTDANGALVRLLMRRRTRLNDKYLVLKLQRFVCTPRLILRKKMLEMTTYRSGTLEK